LGIQNWKLEGLLSLENFNTFLCTNGSWLARVFSLEGYERIHYHLMLRIRSDKNGTYVHSGKAQTKLDFPAHWYGLEYDLNEAILSSGYTIIEHS
jgi:hypothetical protein